MAQINFKYMQMKKNIKYSENTEKFDVFVQWIIKHHTNRFFNNINNRKLNTTQSWKKKVNLSFQKKFLRSTFWKTYKI